MISALHTIRTYPFDLAVPIFSGYPAMKFGHLQSVNGFAEWLAPLALRMIAKAPPNGAPWVLTSPPLQGLPCGANLVCRALARLLATASPDGQAPQLEPIGVGGARLPIRTPAEFEGYHAYSKLDAKTRRQFHMARQERATYDLANFAGRHAVFVNDINVTGTQLARITKLLQKAGVSRLDVLLIVDVERTIGCAFPQLENEINTSRITGLAEFIAYLRDGEFEPTGKLISRLMSCAAHDFAAVFEALRPAQRQTLHRAILQEGLYGGPLFREKIEIVERAVSSG
jgi:hypothetical protein